MVRTWRFSFCRKVCPRPRWPSRTRSFPTARRWRRRRRRGPAASIDCARCCRNGMREFIEKLNDRGEFYLVTTVCFSYAITASAIILLLRVRHVEMTTGRVLRGLVIELVILSTLAAILRLRGWRRADLGLRFSWPAALAGVP